MEKKESVLPPVGKEVVVQCRGFRCLAYRGRDGKWRGVFDQKELPEVLEIFH
ncbi:MAG TPA: hypothetical protein VMA13_06160 [Candidatus Saccharimonadales bacterium]|nr:hypothetical protein [Candidatus Saccharimonadales bacterium]